MKQESVLKPMSIARQEFISSLTDLINNSMLPPFVIEDILKDMHHKLSEISRQQLELDQKRYRESIKKAGINIAEKEDI